MDESSELAQMKLKFEALEQRVKVLEGGISRCRITKVSRLCLHTINGGAQPIPIGP